MSNTKKTEDGRICCTDCGRWVRAEKGGIIMHSSRCDFSGDRTYHADTATVTPTLAQIQHAAREGEISRVLTDDEILDAVRCGVISMGDAMNRDF